MLNFKDEVIIRSGFHMGQPGKVIDIEASSTPRKFLILIEKSGNYKKWINEGEIEKVKPKVVVY